MAQFNTSEIHAMYELFGEMTAHSGKAGIELWSELLHSLAVISELISPPPPPPHLSQPSPHMRCCAAAFSHERHRVVPLGASCARLRR